MAVFSISNTLPSSFAPPEIVVPKMSSWKDEEKFATIVEDRTRELAALDRYERRAISKRKSAIRFDSDSASCRVATSGQDAN